MLERHRGRAFGRGIAGAGARSPSSAGVAAADKGKGGERFVAWFQQARPWRVYVLHQEHCRTKETNEGIRPKMSLVAC